MSAEQNKELKGKEPPLSEEMKQFLKEQEVESEIQAIIDAAIEAGIKKYSREDAIKALLQEEDYKKDD